MIQYLTPSPLLALALLALFTVSAWRAPRTAGLARFRHVLVVLTVWAWLCCTPAITNTFVTAIEGPPPAADADTASTALRAPNTTIVVLGSGEMWTPGRQAAPRLDENGWERLHEGVRLWRRTDGTLVFTGGPGGGDQPTLAGQMGTVARELGVPAAQVALAVRSRTTYEDLVAAKPLIQGNGPVWLVTSAIHMPRAMAVARQLGIDARPYRVDYRQIRQVTWRAWIPDNASADRMNTVLHECVGRLWYQWQGWAH